MAKRRVVFEGLYEGIGKLLRSYGIETITQTAASSILRHAGEGYEMDTYDAGQRKICSVFTATEASKKDNLDNNTLLKATFYD